MFVPFIVVFFWPLAEFLNNIVNVIFQYSPIEVHTTIQNFSMNYLICFLKALFLWQLLSWKQKLFFILAEKKCVTKFIKIDHIFLRIWCHNLVLILVEYNVKPIIQTNIYLKFMKCMCLPALVNNNPVTTAFCV